MSAKEPKGQDNPGKRASSEAELAHDFQTTQRTLAFYAARGLLRPSGRGSQRTYSSDDRARLALIIRAKALGFSLSEIRGILRTNIG